VWATSCTALLDHVADGHFAAVQVLDDAIEGLEDPQGLAVAAG